LRKKIIVIGSGFAGLSVATFLAKDGYDVTVLEKHSLPGGRARKMEANGFTFDMGPSWYWMPDVFERYFNQFGKSVADYYQLHRLNPSYRIYFPNDVLDVPAGYNDLKNEFEKIEPGSGAKLDLFMNEAAYKYKVGIHKLVFKPGISFAEFLDTELAKGLLRLDVFTNMRNHVKKFFKDERLVQLMEFPVLFLGALPQNIPALYSLMNYADVKLGTWYPMGGMYKIVEGMQRVAVEQGVQFLFNQNAESIKVVNGKTTGVVSNGVFFDADAVVSGADYHYTETKLLEPQYRTYSDAYWDKRVMAPSCLLYYVGINKKLSDLPHHTLFFDTDFNEHGREIYKTPQWPTNPLFYVSITTATDPSGAPDGCENMFFLIPIAAGLQHDSELVREQYFHKIVKRFEERTGQEISGSIVYKKSFSVSDFKNEYNAYKGNAYGLANTLLQTAILKPGCSSKKISNLYFTGQLTVPGPGVPPSLISGEVVAKQVHKYLSKR
jgi:phytoene desaturase